VIVRPPRFYSDLADSLIDMWLEKFKANDTSPWCVTVEVNPPIDPGCSGLRNELREKLLDRQDADGLPLLSLRRRWLAPVTRREGLYKWKHRNQMVEFTLVERDPDDPRTRNLMDYMNDPIREAEKLREKEYDYWEKRNKFGRAFRRAKTDLGPVSPLLPEMKSRYRFLPGEKVDEFLKRMGIRGMSMTAWAERSGYPLGADITPEQQAEWSAGWFGSEKAAELEKEVEADSMSLKDAAEKIYRRATALGKSGAGIAEPGVRPSGEQWAGPGSGTGVGGRAPGNPG
jgi:hypothetical protein